VYNVTVHMMHRGFFIFDLVDPIEPA